MIDWSDENQAEDTPFPARNHLTRRGKVCLVYLVGLVCFVCLVSLARGVSFAHGTKQTKKPEKPHGPEKLNEPDERSSGWRTEIARLLRGG